MQRIKDLKQIGKKILIMWFSLISAAFIKKKKSATCQNVLLLKNIFT